MVLFSERIFASSSQGLFSPIVWLWHYLLNCQLGCQWLESRHNSQLPPSVSMAWDIIECVAWEEEGIFLAVDHNVVPNVDKVKYMGIALHTTVVVYPTLPKQ